MPSEVIINADDFGISKGVNAAVVSMHKQGNLTGASLMITAKYANEAIELAKQNPTLKIGLHFNLTTGKSVLYPVSLPILINENNEFKNGFLKLLLLSIFKRKLLLQEVEAELKAQISQANAQNISLSHIDGHRHIHYIPGIFKLVQKVAKEYNISRVRVINEKLFSTIFLKKIPPISGIIKWLVLRFLGFLNGSRSIPNPPYFFSIIHTSRITNSLLANFKIPKGFQGVEIMIHPSFTKLDSTEKLEYEKPHLTSHFREEESRIIRPTNI